jgi:hypothetical protein
MFGLSVADALPTISTKHRDENHLRKRSTVLAMAMLRATTIKIWQMR